MLAAMTLGVVQPGSRRRRRLHPVHRLAVAGGAGRRRLARDVRRRDPRARAGLQTARSDPAGTARHRRAVAGRVRAGAGRLCEGSEHRAAGGGGAEADAEASRRARARSKRASACPASVVLAIWGRETDYGRYTLPYDALRVLATQAYVGRRKDQYRSEFILALKLLGEGEVTRKDLRSSWAGATGLHAIPAVRILQARRRSRRRRPPSTSGIRCRTRWPPPRSNSSTRAGSRACAGPMKCARPPMSIAPWACPR